jgi:tricarballylate dehydrogenase
MLPKWMSEHGAAWQQPLAGTLSLGRTNRFFLGGGKALLNAYYRTAHTMGITVRYDAFVEDLLIENDRFEAVVVRTGDARDIVRARALVVATGGYEANMEWLKRHWGPAADNFIVRGTPYNDGAMLANLLSKSAKPMGDPQGFHAVAVDARSPKFDGGIVTRLDAIPFGVVVNKFAQRFYDEGEAIWPKRYAIWGGLIAGQPDQIAYVIVDAKTIGRFLPPMFKPYRADSLEALARALHLDSGAFTSTLNGYNRATSGQTEQRLETPDGNGTRGISPPKSNWAIPIDTPPFYGLPLRPGITFTYMGVAVDDTCRVLTQTGRPFHNVYAAGEIMSGNILTKGYLAGFGMTIGAVFGETAGRMAATNARA